MHAHNKVDELAVKNTSGGEASSDHLVILTENVSSDFLRFGH